jgi:predicted transcriptional regulator
MKISDSEMEIMKVIWSHDEAVTSAQIAEDLDTEWKPTTILTFLKRLTDKGIISTEKSGKSNCYKAVITENEYKSRQTEKFLKEFHSGSVKNFLTALFGEKKPTKQEIEEIKEWFEEV